MEKLWYQCSREELIKYYYSNYTINNFWEWWNGKDNNVMELRVNNFEVINKVKNKLNVPYSTSGFYVKNGNELKNVIALTRNISTVWFGIQPRKKSINKKGWNNFGSGDKGGSSDYNVSSINFIFIDIDRILKENVATNNDLMYCDKLCNEVLEVMDKNGWANNYIKICSGHGLQLLIKLDVPIKLPNITFTNVNNFYLPEENIEFNKIKGIFKNGIGKQITSFCKKKTNEYGVEIDTSCFNISRVGAMPFTKNFKYNTEVWRGIVEIKSNGENSGLSDYILEIMQNNKMYIQKNIGFKASRTLTSENIIKKGKLKENILAKFLIENNFPSGGINNTLWFQMKILLRDSKFDLNSREFIEFHNFIKKKHGRTFTLNMPAENYTFNSNVINNYCIENNFTPIYCLWPNKNKRINYGLDFNNWDEVLYSVEEDFYLPEEKNIYEDMLILKSKLIFNETAYNKKLFIDFIKKCIKKYTEERTKYFYYNLFPEFFTRE